MTSKSDFEDNEFEDDFDDDFDDDFEEEADCQENPTYGGQQVAVQDGCRKADRKLRQNEEHLRPLDRMRRSDPTKAPSR